MFKDGGSTHAKRLVNSKCKQWFTSESGQFTERSRVGHDLIRYSASTMKRLAINSEPSRRHTERVDGTVTAVCLPECVCVLITWASSPCPAEQPACRSLPACLRMYVVRNTSLLPIAARCTCKWGHAVSNVRDALCNTYGCTLTLRPTLHRCAATAWVRLC
jgi:hypothetical protein